MSDMFVYGSAGLPLFKISPGAGFVLTEAPAGTYTFTLAAPSAIGTAIVANTNFGLPAGIAGVSPLRITEGIAPAAPVNGDVWTTAAGLLARTNAVTRGPLQVYEENTWIPAVTSGGGTLPTFTSESGTYTRLGRLVFANWLFDNTIGGTAGVGANQISTSLPFTTSVNQLPIRIPVGTAQDGIDEHMIYGSIPTAGNTMLLWRLEEAGNNPILLPLDCVDFANANIRQLALMIKLLIANP